MTVSVDIGNELAVLSGGSKASRETRELPRSADGIARAGLRNILQSAMKSVSAFLLYPHTFSISTLRTRPTCNFDLT